LAIVGHGWGFASVAKDKADGKNRKPLSSKVINNEKGWFVDSATLFRLGVFTIGRHAFIYKTIQHVLK